MSQYLHCYALSSNFQHALDVRKRRIEPQTRLHSFFDINLNFSPVFVPFEQTTTRILSISMNEKSRTTWMRSIRSVFESQTYWKSTNCSTSLHFSFVSFLLSPDYSSTWVLPSPLFQEVANPNHNCCKDLKPLKIIYCGCTGALFE